MKIKICRMSGLPVELEDLDNFKNEFRRLFDKASSIAKTDMLRLQRRMSTIERILQTKYPTLTEVDFPSTAEAWKDLQAKYGNILVSQMRDSGDLFFVISDQEEIQY